MLKSNYNLLLLKNQTNFFKMMYINKELCILAGSDAAFVYAYLGNLYQNKEFNHEQYKICSDLNLSKYKVTIATRKLIECGLIEFKKHLGKKNKYKLLSTETYLFKDL